VGSTTIPALPHAARFRPIRNTSQADRRLALALGVASLTLLLLAPVI